eukprot:TRINITY_DN36110_c0_g1_i1.p1 TRINITY_DN36110_c0_g1~~TRINITY_DN36110_c0_g1_i1.p1  ORF type:complete len:344 (-),score=67.62 TRINITY_DN36110_c0_g1_i1:51-1082(-)
MGGYFALQGGAEWDATIEKTSLPSIWSNVNFSPLVRSQHVLFSRPGHLSFISPTSSIKQGGDYVRISECTDVHMLVGYDEDSGRFYTGILLEAQAKMTMHKYSRTVEEVATAVPSNIRPPKEVPSSPAGSLGETRWAQHMTESLTQGGSLTSAVKTPKRSTLQSQTPMSLENFGETGEDPPSQEHQYPYCLLYMVKEGILAYFADDLESCEEVIRSVGARRRDAEAPPSPPGHSIPETPHSSAFPQIKSMVHHIGRAPPLVCRILIGCLQAELKREWKVKCDHTVQDNYTNCAVFCMRVMMALQLGIRGFDIVKECEKRKSLGPKCGKAVAEAWERLWRQVRP